MSTILHSTATIGHGNSSVGEIWNRLHDERENIREALLKSSHPKLATLKSEKSQINSGANWRREMLQARLRKIDDALDRLMAGSYGNCCKCGRWIEDTKLNFDPAIAFCIDCWQRQQSRN
jgi:RNA polymerase-binding transcription factor DksA